MTITNNGTAKVNIEFNTVSNNQVLVGNSDINQYEIVKYKTLPKWLTVIPNKLTIEKTDFSTRLVVFKFCFNFIQTQHLFTKDSKFKYHLIMKVQGRNDVFLTFNFTLKPTSLNKTISDMCLHPKGYNQVQPVAYCPLGIPKEIWRLCDAIKPHVGNPDLLKDFLPVDSHSNEYHLILQDLDNHIEFTKDYEYHRLLELLYIYLINLPESIIPSKLRQSVVGCVETSVEDIDRFFNTFNSVIPVCHYNLFVYMISFLREIIQHNPSINFNNILVRFFLPCFIHTEDSKLSPKESVLFERFLMHFINKIN